MTCPVYKVLGGSLPWEACMHTQLEWVEWVGGWGSEWQYVTQLIYPLISVIIITTVVCCFFLPSCFLFNSPYLNLQSFDFSSRFCFPSYGGGREKTKQLHGPQLPAEPKSQEWYSVGFRNCWPWLWTNWCSMNWPSHQSWSCGNDPVLCQFHQKSMGLVHNWYTKLCRLFLLMQM